jgi:hypothetical protein
MSIDSERQLFRVLPQELSSRIERTVYNKRHRALFEKKHHLQQLMAEKITLVLCTGGRSILWWCMIFVTGVTIVTGVTMNFCHVSRKQGFARVADPACTLMHR